MKKKLTLFLLIVSVLSLSTFFYSKGLKWDQELKIKSRWFAAPKWMKNQIQADLSLISSEEIHPDKLEHTLRENTERGDPFMLVHCKIRNNTLEMNLAQKGEGYPNEYIHRLRAKIIKASLEELLSLVKIPDVDFLLSLADAADQGQFSAPVFAFAKNSTLNEKILLIPDFEALEGNATILKALQKGAKRYPWEKKLDCSIWRGAMTGLDDFTEENFTTPPRSQLIAQSLMHPYLINAKYTMLSQCSQPEAIRQRFSDYFAEPMRLALHLEYKYQILVDGNSCAYSRAFWQLFSHSLIFKQNSPHIQWYYRSLLPRTHYIPVASDFSDLAEKIEWAKQNDALAKKIGANAYQFAKTHLSKTNVYLYVYHLLNEYAQVQNLK